MSNKITHLTADSIFIDGIEYRINQTISSLEGIISRVKHERPYGKGWIRNALLDGKLKLNIVDKREVNESYEGKTVVIQGAILVEEDYQGKRLALKINGKSKIECISDSRIVCQNDNVQSHAKSELSSDWLERLDLYFKYCKPVLENADAQAVAIGASKKWHPSRIEKMATSQCIPILERIADSLQLNCFDLNQSTDV